MSTDAMPMFESLSFALLIPFAICFILIFLVCCFADEIKDICRMPSPLPASYLAAHHTQPRRHSRRPRRRQNDEGQNLILSEEGRSRNVSESSADQTALNMTVSSSAILNGPTMTLIRPSVSNNVAVVSEIAGCDNHMQRLVPSCSNTKDFTCVTLNSAQHSVIRINNYNDTKRNFLRNLSMNSSALTVPCVPDNCANSSVQRSANTCSSKSNAENAASIVRNKSAPHTLNKYLTSMLPHASISETTHNTETGAHDDSTVSYNESRKT